MVEGISHKKWRRRRRRRRRRRSRTRKMKLPVHDASVFI
jgi:hypothetical protein